MKIQQSKPYMDDTIKSAVLSTLDSGQFVKGPQVVQFEAEFSIYCNTSNAIATNSGTSAILLSLIALGIKPGDEIIVPSHTFIATVAPIKHLGAIPIYCDIDPKTYTVDTTKIPDLVTPKTKAIFPVHLYGHPADMTQIQNVANVCDIKVIEDACQAHGALYKTEKVGSLGDIAVFSFFPSKNLSVCGEGGMVTTNDENLAYKVRKLRDHGRLNNNSIMLGYNFRMSEIHATIGRCQLPHLDSWNDARIRIAEKYTSELSGIVETPKFMPWAKCVYHQYVIQCDERDDLKDYLAEKGVQTNIHYPISVHQQTSTRSMIKLPHTEKCVNRILSLPMYPSLGDEEIDFITTKIVEFMDEN